MTPVRNLNQRAGHLTEFAKSRAETLRIGVEQHDGVQLLDFGVKAACGLEAGVLLAKICLAGMAEVEIVPGDSQLTDVPQAFSHFSYEHSKGKQLVCDLQGVWNEEDGFVLTDPVVHYVSENSKKHVNGATDKGLEGVRKFFRTHTCDGLCAKMQLPVRSEFSLISQEKK